MLVCGCGAVEGELASGLVVEFGGYAGQVVVVGAWFLGVGWFGSWVHGCSWGALHLPIG